eukprot:scaffold907_cov398-Prasinococcus_capsulatus_cf.AAC.2
MHEAGTEGLLLRSEIRHHARPLLLRRPRDAALRGAWRAPVARLLGTAAARGPHCHQPPGWFASALCVPAGRARALPSPLALVLRRLPPGLQRPCISPGVGAAQEDRVRSCPSKIVAISPPFTILYMSVAHTVPALQSKLGPVRTCHQQILDTAQTRP